MAIYESSEDYLERILMLKQEHDVVISLDVANSMGYSKASISRAMKILKESNYITIGAKGSIELTDSGMKIASKMLERHNLLTSYFEKLGVSHEIAKKDACKIEHDLSDETFSAIIKHVENKR